MLCKGNNKYISEVYLLSWLIMCIERSFYFARWLGVHFASKRKQVWGGCEEVKRASLSKVTLLQFWLITADWSYGPEAWLGGQPLNITGARRGGWPVRACYVSGHTDWASPTRCINSEHCCKLLIVVCMYIYSRLMGYYWVRLDSKLVNIMQLLSWTLAELADVSKTTLL